MEDQADNADQPEEDEVHEHQEQNGAGAPDSSSDEEEEQLIDNSQEAEPEASATQITIPEIELDDNLTDDDLPSPYGSRPRTPVESNFTDKAEYLVKKRFAPMTDPQKFIAALTKVPPGSRSTAVLYALAENAQEALKEWQDEYLYLDARTAPHTHPPKKPAIGGRQPQDPVVFEAMKEADLYNYTFDPKKAPDAQDPFAQRLGRDPLGSRELRRRRGGHDVVGESEMDDGIETRRQRKPVARYDGTMTPQGRGRGRKRALASETPDPTELPPRKRGRQSAQSLAPYNRIRELREEREESVMTASTDDGTGTPQPGKRRGRPPGSKNVNKRSDAGIKKGPRKKYGDDGTPQAVTPMSAPASVADARTIEGATQVLSALRDGTATPQSPADSPMPYKRKQRVKSEKRSASMAKWWAERKAKEAEDKKAKQAEEASQQAQYAQQMSQQTLPSLSQQLPPSGSTFGGQPIMPVARVGPHISPYAPVPGGYGHQGSPPAPGFAPHRSSGPVSSGPGRGRGHHHGASASQHPIGQYSFDPRR